MKICVKCHQMIPEPNIACPACVLSAAAAGVARAQTEYLMRVTKGDWDIQFAVVRGVTHATLFQEPARTYCNMALTKPKRSSRPWWEVEAAVRDSKSARIDQFCASCGAALNQALEALREQTVPAAAADAI